MSRKNRIVAAPCVVCLQVNARLQVVGLESGHSSNDDPEHSKIQWPDVQQCPECHRHGNSGEDLHTWDEQAVVVYLDR